MWAGISATVAAIGLATPSAAASDTAPATDRIVVMTEAETPAVRRLRDELAALGLTVVLEPATGSGSPDELAAAARGKRAFAAIRLLQQAAAVEVWVSDRVTGKTTFRSIAARAGREISADVAVLRAVELLRVSLVELSLPQAPRGEVPPAPAVLELARAERERPPTSQVWSAGGALWSAGGAGTIPTVMAGVRLDLPARLALDLWATIPVAGAPIRGAEGEALVSPRLAAATLWLRLAPGKRLRGAVGAGLAATWVRTRGVPAAGWSGSTDDFVGIAALVQAGAAVGLTRRIALVGEAALGATAAHDSIRFSGHEVAGWGWPFVAAGLGLALGWN